MLCKDAPYAHGCYYLWVLNKSLFKISMVGAGNIANAILGFVFLAAAARTLPVQEFGKYALLTSVLVAVAKIMDFGTNSIFVTHTISKDKNLSDGFITLKIILFTIASLLALLVLQSFKLLDTYVGAVFLLGLIGYGINITLFAFFQKSESFHLAVILNTVPAIIKGAAGTAIILGLIKLDLFQLFGVFSTSMLSCGLLLAAKPAPTKKFTLSLSRAFNFIKDAYPGGVSQLINESWMALSNGLIKVSKTYVDVGLFSLANKIANIFALISLSVFTVLLPKNAARKKQRLAYDIAETLFIALGMIILAIILTLVSELFVGKVFGSQYTPSTSVLGMLIFASSITAVHTFMENYFYVEEKIKTMMIISITKLVVFLLLALALTPALSIQGMAIAQLASAVLTLLLVAIVVITDLKKRTQDQQQSVL